MQRIHLTLLMITVAMLTGCTPPSRPKVQVRIVAAPGSVQGESIPAPKSSQNRSVGEIASVWLMRPVQQKLEYDPKTHIAKGVVMIEVGENILFRVEAKRTDGVTLYAGETMANITVNDRFKEISVILLPVPGSIDITANVHEVTGPPTIQLTYVPPIGSFDDLQGKVENINPSLVAVAVYIYVVGRWWTKPYWNAPKTPVRSNGTWVCDITTGGIDEQATKIRAYLIRKDYEPPLAPQQGLPPDPPNADVLAMVEVTRQ